METNSEGENPKPGNKGTGSSGGDGSNKPKRQMKTPFQLETLEKAFALETYPSESTRSELSEKLGLTDRQLQMWFCHRRLKDKKETPSKKPRKETSARESPPRDDLTAAGPDLRDDYGSGSASGSSPFTEPRKISQNETPTRRYFESPQSIMELRAIACVEAQLGESLREDGPILGVEFDPLPPGAFGAPIVPLIEQQKRMTYHHDPQEAYKRTLHEYQFLQEQPSSSQASFKDISSNNFRELPFVLGDDNLTRVNCMSGFLSRDRYLNQQEKKEQYMSCYKDDSSHFQRELLNSDVKTSAHAAFVSEYPENYPESREFHCDVDLRLDRKRKSDESRIAKEVEAHEIRIRKELEKQNILRRKNEERMKKEFERMERERKKEEERMLRERQREEEKMQREQKREIERREKFLQKEYIRAEKRRQKEELRREKEAEKRKAAIEKATARKIAKEALDLIEDEQLELMELAAANKDLDSIAQLNYESLQSLDMFRDSLSLFPPDSVELKNPIAIQPWVDSDENIGNLLMAWKFFSCFADVLNLWPFTLQEFVQAFHDYDSRLLGEMHISLLKLIIKDIEDVARTPTGGLGTNQYSAVNPEGGHPKIVEGAYMWGFDIRNWQRYLSPLTWPEIFRQLALASGLGPVLKKRSATWSFLADVDKQGKGCEDTISTLRNGSAAENAFVRMREKGLLVPRKSRHRLTPGTVKFAAFHVLSLEGSKGLTVLELADKIQKSGLRDLTTSKTPEASISVALTRDQKLFERIAPSTYCVRTAFRKDPVDSESILLSARKKIRMFENGFAAEDADDPDRDEESEGEIDEDPEVDDLGTPLITSKTMEIPNEINSSSDRRSDDNCNDLLIVKNMKDPDVPVKIEPNDGVDPDDMEIDESKTGESWIQGLSEGDYAHLSVEERLNALVSLVEIANEGNTLRGILEERLESANSLKKQMWNEAQLDRSRLKEDIIPKLDINASPCATENVKTSPDGVQIERMASVQDASVNPDSGLNLHNGFASKRSRSQLKAYIGHAAEAVYSYRSLPLGQDRRRNRYWQFVASASKNDPCSGKIFVELHNGKWRTIESIQAFDALLTSLDPRGLRESHLRIMLRKIEKTFKESVKQFLQISSEISDISETDLSCNNESPSSGICGPSSDYSAGSGFGIQLGRTRTEKMAALGRFKDFQKWLWKESLNSSRLSSMKFGNERFIKLMNTCEWCLETYFSENFHCNSCHQTFNVDDQSFSFSEHQLLCEETKNSNSDCPHLGIKILKTFVSLLEISVPSDAFESHWTENFRRKWMVKLEKTTLIEEIMQLITVYESSIKRDSLSSTFETTKELLKIPFLSISESIFQESIPVLPWMPKTFSAVALRLYELDNSIIYMKKEKPESCEEKPLYMKLPSRYPQQEEYSKKEDRVGRKISKKTQKKTPAKSKMKEEVEMNQGRRVGGQGRGRRTVRKRREEKVLVESSSLGGKFYGSGREVEEEDEWVDEKGDVEMEVAENSSSGEAADSDEIVEEDYEQDKWGQGRHVASNGWLEGSMQESDSGGEDFGDENAVDDDRVEDSDEVGSQIEIDDVSDSVSDDYSG